MNKPIVLLKGKTFINAWIELLSELTKIKMPTSCEQCKYSEFCLRCPGVLMAECGSYNKVDEAFCNRAKALYYEYYKKG